ncbi:Protein of unknown function (DUF2993) [Actinoplanes xinjiangensis]|uniref:DUF2993 family protein n=1 Tax=Actinoplanes xinjiangensis TaxID=512350 RepID=A0A316FFZ2_9ACTN|nr:DUF2993 domain-containing protein [Actinoplanes xinjiangensis]PWK46710.1 Protein of unknown function (DUF2993) [Actinoplanes xinjiangensis]GIF40467.1 hypothetical protein Axi01nite_47780 [Actinoplanes xinjiangensis]
MAEVYGSERPRRRRGRGLRIVVLTLLVFLIVGVVVLDRFSNSYAENVIAEKVATEVANQKAESSRPVVTIAGVPFLTQVVAGKYEEIQIELPDFKAQTGTGETIRMDLLDIRARDVKAPLSALRGQGDVVAGSVTGTGTIDYQLLADATGQKDLKLAEKDGKLVGSGVLAITQTQEFPVSASADLKVADGRVQVRFSDVSTPGLTVNPLIQSQVDGFVQQMAFELDVPKLPLNLVIQELQPLPEGLRFTFGASDVNLAAAGV